MAALLTICLSGAPALAQSQVELGEQAFQRCLPCHAIGQGAANKVGPPLNGVLGRPIGGLDSFGYSRTLQEANAAGMLWTPATLTRLLKNTRHAFPGTSMSFAGMRHRADIEAIIDYLGRFATDGSQTPP